MRIRWSPLVIGLLLATAAAADPPLPWEPTDKIHVESHEDKVELSWLDAEERLRGSIHPAVPREGQPFRVDLQVGSFEGSQYEGPLVLTLREVGAHHGQSITVPYVRGHWEATFTPEHEGPHLLDVTFRTTRHKALHAPIEVGATQVPRTVGWAVLGLGCLAAFGYTVRNLLKGEQPEAPPLPMPADEPAPPGATPTAAPVVTAVVDTSPAPGAEAPRATEPPAASPVPAPGAEMTAATEPLVAMPVPAPGTEAPPTTEPPVETRPPVPGSEIPPATEPPVATLLSAPGSETPPTTEPPVETRSPVPGSEAAPEPPALPTPAAPPAVGAEPSSSTPMEAENKPPESQ